MRRRRSLGLVTSGCGCKGDGDRDGWGREEGCRVGELGSWEGKSY